MPDKDQKQNHQDENRTSEKHWRMRDGQYGSILTATDEELAARAEERRNATRGLLQD